MSRLILIFFGLTFFVSTQASLKESFEIESIIEDRLRKVISPVDEKVQVFVKVLLQADQKIKLPGTSLELLNLPSDGVKPLDFSRIEEIRISVYSQLDPFPAWLQAELKQIFEDNKVKTSFRFNVAEDTKPKEPEPEPEPETEKDKQDPKPESDLVSEKLRDLSHLVRENWPALVFVFGVLAGISLVIFWVFFLLQLRQGERSAEKLAGAIKEISPSDEGPANKVEPFAGAPSVSAGLPDVNNEVQSLDMASLCAVLSDCYWCDEDEYFTWLWAAMNSEQKRQVISIWPEAANYARFTQGRSGRNLRYHLHPSYLQPLPLHKVSNEDLSELVNKKPGLWNRLTPMRQNSLSLSLEQKLVCIKSSLMDSEEVEWTGLESVQKEHKNPVEVGRLSFEDEERVLDQPDLVPDEIRTHVDSLVWLAILPEEQRRQALADISAEQLASAWVGSKNVLDRIEQVLPEKKRARVQQYRERITPSRDTSAYKLLVSRAHSSYVKAA